MVCGKSTKAMESKLTVWFDYILFSFSDDLNIFANDEDDLEYINYKLKE